MENTEKDFKKWLKTKVDTIAPISSYPNALKQFIPNKLKELNENIFDTLFECSDFISLNLVYIMGMVTILSFLI